MSARDAKKFFLEAERYLNPKTDPAMVDLMRGLAKMADDIQNEFDQLHREIRDLEHAVRRK